MGLRARVALMMALSGALFTAVLVSEDIPRGVGFDLATLPWGLILRYLAAMAAGGALAGWLLAGWFGRRGAAGWALALAAGVVVSVAGGIAGSALGLAPDLLRDGWQSRDTVAVLAGALVLPLAAVGHLWVVGLWLVLVGATHQMVRPAR